MERWVGKTAVVTGASAGIGAAVCVALADAGIRVVGVARRAERVDALQSKVRGNGTIVTRKCDVSKPEEVAAMFQWVEETFGAVHIMINNAGVFYPGGTTDAGNNMIREENLIATLDINVKGTMLCARHAVNCMKRHGVDGHVINVNSIAGHYVPHMPTFNVYTGSKYAITGFSEGLLNELAYHKNRTKVTSLSPALVNTELNGVAELQEMNMPALQPEEVADAILYVLSTPPHVNNPEEPEEARPIVLVKNCSSARNMSILSDKNGDGAGSSDLCVCTHITKKDAGNNMIKEEDLIATLDINVKGTMLCARHAVNCMKRHGVDGHVINVNSIAGYYVPHMPTFNVYTGSKYAITGFSEGLLNELAHHKNRTKVTSLSPALVNTELNGVAELQEMNMPALQPEEVADAILYVLSTPPHVNINELTISSVTELRA